MAPPRRPTYPLAHSFRTKPRRLPLVLRFTRGSIHHLLIAPVLLHSLFTALIVYLDTYIFTSLGLPSTIIPSLSIVVGLMLVFRNGTSYDRFWTGRNCLTSIGTAVRNLARIMLVNAKVKGDGHREGEGGLTEEERRDTEKILRVLVAILYAVKHNLRAEFNIPPASLASLPPPTSPFVASHSRPVSRRPSYTDHSPDDTSADGIDTENGADNIQTAKAEYTSLLPEGLMGYEDQGLGLPLQLSILVEGYIRRGFDRSWFHAPLASQMTVQVNSLVDAYGRMETIRSTPIPVAHLIHQKQVLALFLIFLPLGIVGDYGWYSIPIVAIVSFTLYGIEGIGQQLEDPFGYDKNDIKMDGIIEDTRREVMVMLDEWDVARRRVEMASGSGFVRGGLRWGENIGRGRGLGGMFE